MRTSLMRAAAIASLATLASCASATRTSSGGDWQSLIDPQLSEWRGYKSATLPSGWSVTDGVLHKSAEVHDLVTRRRFRDFELEWDWKLGEGGNSGVFYRGGEDYDYIFWTAPEYQLLDDARHPDGKLRLTAAGSAFGLYPAPAGVVKPANEWNASRIVVQGNHVEHWLNGVRTASYDLASPEWEAKVKASKFGQWAKYGRLPDGMLSIQGDHVGDLSIRNMRIREIR